MNYNAMRVHELAKELKLSTKDLLTFAHDIGIKHLTTNFSAVTPEEVATIYSRLDKRGAEGAPAAPSESAAPKAIIKKRAQDRVNEPKPAEAKHEEPQAAESAHKVIPIPPNPKKQAVEKPEPVKEIKEEAKLPVQEPAKAVEPPAIEKPKVVETKPAPAVQEPPAVSQQPAPSAPPPRTERPPFDPNRPRTERPPFDPNRPRTERPPFDPNRPRGDRPPFDPNRPRTERPPFDPNRPRTERPPFDPNRPRPERPPFDPNRPRTERPPFDPNRPRPERPPFDPNRPRGDRPPFDPNRPRQPFDPNRPRPAGGDIKSPFERPPADRGAPSKEGGAPDLTQKPFAKKGHAPSRPKTFQEKKNKEQERIDKIHLREKQEEANFQPVEEIALELPISLGDFANKVRIPATRIIKDYFLKGMMLTINQSLDKEMAEKICDNYNIILEVLPSKQEQAMIDITDKPEELVTRAPVVTIMGHVDHGKTRLLDYIRKTNVVAGEAGGITQHIGAYHVDVGEKKIVFLDTPGHEAFTAMRARGAQVTDITILVVAADDGVMPQTIEAINHAKAAKVPIIVAINKVDKPSANPEKIMQQLTEYELVPEEWGGSTVMCKVSAMTGQGIPELLEMILLVAEIQDLKANPNRKARGIVIEAHLSKNRGPVATLLVQKGTLKVGDSFVAGHSFGKVKALVDDRGKRIKEAGCSTPVEIMGFDTVPAAGDIFQVIEDEKLARDIANIAFEKAKAERLASLRHVSLDSLNTMIQEGKIKDINLVIKADVQGSVEALAGLLIPLSNDKVKVNIIHKATGEINEADIMLASASNAIVIAFGVPVSSAVKKIAAAEHVEVREFNIIYQIVDDIRDAIEGLLEPEFEEVFQGKAEVRHVFSVGKTKAIAGCYVQEGKLIRNSIMKVYRNKKELFVGTLEGLKRFKDDVKEVATGYECGISCDDFNEYEIGDTVEVYMKQQKRKAKTSNQ